MREVWGSIPGLVRSDAVLPTTCYRCHVSSELCCPGAKQGRQEKFGAPGQKFRLSPLVSGPPKSRDEQKKIIASADVRILARNQVMSKKRVIASGDVQISAQHLVMSKIRS